MNAPEKFTSRWGLLVAAIGMAVGTGNIWRFPRVVASSGGGAFLVPWLLFLFLWAIPLLIVESTMGRHTGKGVVGAFGKLIGRRFMWMGCFVGFCTMGIMFYYSVVAGWCIKYLLGALLGSLSHVESVIYWDVFQATKWEPLVFHFIAMAGCGLITHRGVVSGIEKASKTLIPLLFVLLIAAAVKALTLPSASDGLDFLFNPDWTHLLNYRTWLEALTQSAWSTGAGWGLLLTYGVYTHQRDDIVVNSITIGLGNNLASMLAAIAIIPTVFAVVPATEASNVLQQSGPASTGLTFIWIPRLFDQIPGGSVFLILFFLALVMAALSSLIAMIELAVRVFMDAGLPRDRSVLYVVASGFVLGIPSAVSLSFFSNQDATWGIGLMLSGLLFAVAVRRFGVEGFRRELIATANNDLPVGAWFDIALKYLIPVEFAIMMSWWLWQASTSGEVWWNPFGVFTLGTCVFQWGVALLLFWLANDAIARRTLGDEQEPSP